jgi:hypothetical protein
MTDQPFDEKYWGPGGPDISRWGRGQVARGAQYKTTGAASVAGAKNQRRTFTGGRKERGSSVVDFEKQEARKP